MVHATLIEMRLDRKVVESHLNNGAQSTKHESEINFSAEAKRAAGVSTDFDDKSFATLKYNVTLTGRSQEMDIIKIEAAYISRYDFTVKDITRDEIVEWLKHEGAMIDLDAQMTPMVVREMNRTLVECGLLAQLPLNLLNLAKDEATRAASAP